MEGSAPVKRATAGFALSLVAGIFVILDGLVLIWASAILSDLGIGDIAGVGLTLNTLGAVGIVFAIIILIGAFLIYMPGKEMIGGILVLIFSIISIVTGGGFLLGMILGIIGGALGLAKK